MKNFIIMLMLALTSSMYAMDPAKIYRINAEDLSKLEKEIRQKQIETEIKNFPYGKRKLTTREQMENNQRIINISDEEINKALKRIKKNDPISTTKIEKL